MNRSVFDFAPAKWMPLKDKAVLEHCRNIRRERKPTYLYNRDNNKPMNILTFDIEEWYLEKHSAGIFRKKQMVIAV